jgi:hypothetical protein
MVVTGTLHGFGQCDSSTADSPCRNSDNGSARIAVNASIVTGLAR